MEDVTTLIDGFDEVAPAGEYLLGAFALMRGVEGVIVDLRRNGGAAPGAGLR